MKDSYNTSVVKDREPCNVNDNYNPDKTLKSKFDLQILRGCQQGFINVNQ